MATDFFSSASSPSVMAGLFVAGLGAVYAYARMGPGHTHAGDLVSMPTPTDATPNVDEDERAGEGSELNLGSVARRRRKRKTKRTVVGAGEGEQDDEASRVVQGSGGGGGGGVPGSFEGTRGDMDAHVDVPMVTRAASLAGASGKNKKRKHGKGKGRNRAKTEGEAKDSEQDDEEGSETGKEGARTADAPHSSDTDASVSRLPTASVSTFALASSRAIRASTKLPHPDLTRAASRPREIRPSPSLSLDTDSSWTHVGRKRLDASGARTLPDSVDLTSSDIASTASDSPVAERMGGADDVRGVRALEDRRTLAERLVPRPGKSDVDDMLERPDGPALARVMRVQEVPVPGFSWEDYGGDSLLVHDADEEDEGEWGVVKSRRNRTQLPETMTAPTSSPVSTPAMTKKQRQNARKRELAKSAKADAEAVRLEGLAKHKHELERVRAVERSRSRI